MADVIQQQGGPLQKVIIKYPEVEKQRENFNQTPEMKCLEFEVDIKYFRKSRTTGHNVSYYCNYADSPAVVDSFSKFICKGDDPRVCQTIVNSSTPENERFSMKDEKDHRNIIVTMRELTVKDSGSYWCGAETSDGEGGKIFFKKLSLTVGPAQSSSSASPLILTTEPSVGSHSGSQAHISVVIRVVLVLLLLLLVPVSTLIYKRCSASKTSAAPNRNSTKEDSIYEEMKARPPPMPDYVNMPIGAASDVDG
ncbi:CMRF35-like molecule 1 [Salarias fasciatus]|uniref:CMRF35-like molecule 1 n=1 Tax=Salarias fasciatus TaxID=181472 RepID=UPI00117654BD|nr:CMRF35-like molecule 1 [Salarias fasciatus]